MRYSSINLVTALLASIALGCGSTSSDSVGPNDQVGAGGSGGTTERLGWPEVMRVWGTTEGSSSIYSLGFFEPPPDGSFVRAISYASEMTDACDVFSGEQYLGGSSTRDDWVLFLHASLNQTGPFEISWQDQVGGDPTAQVIVKHIVNGEELERHTALEGLITVQAVAATTDDQKAGAELELNGEVEFSTKEAFARDGCAVRGQGDDVVFSCVCHGPDGASFTCESKKDAGSCCIDLDVPRTKINISIRATQCAAACLASDLQLSRYCVELGSGGTGGGGTQL